MKSIRSNRGFTLMEMSVVLVIIALILGAVTVGRDVYRGAVAERKVEALLHAGAMPMVGSQALTDALQAWLEAGRIRWLAGEFHEDWLREVWLVIAATDDAAVNRIVAAAAQARRNPSAAAARWRTSTTAAWRWRVCPGAA